MTDLLQVKDLKVHFRVAEGLIKAVDGVSFRVPVGKTVALVSDDMWQAHRMLPLVREKLQAQYPDTTFIAETEFPMGSRLMDTDETVDMLEARGVDAVIVGNAS